MNDTPRLRPSDLEMFKAIGVSERTAVGLAQVRRVTHEEAKEICGVQYKSRRLEGIAFPYLDPGDFRVLTWRVRRDNPEIDTDGAPIAKYVSPPDRRHLYITPGAFTECADTSIQAIVVESEKAVLAITDAAHRAACRPHLGIGTGGCWGWRGVTGKGIGATGARVDEKGPVADFDKVAWTGRGVVIVFDSNVATNSNVQAARRALAAELEKRGAAVRVVDLPIEEGLNGPDDYIARHGHQKFWQLVDAAKPLAAKTTEKLAKAKQGHDVQLNDPEPWPEPVNGAELLEAISETFTKYLAISQSAATAVALWVLHAYTFDCWFATPFLAVTSPQKRCGKTLLLIVLGALVPRRLFAANITPAVLFRAIEKFKPTLLIDEADTFIKDNDELRGVLNSGHTRATATVIRAVGDDYDPRAFSTWCAKAIALIGTLPDTLGDRSIEIRMRRRAAGEYVERLRQDRIESECLSLRRQAARWAADHLDALRGGDPDIPTSLHDRAADCWRPLLAIAERVGGNWPRLAREATEELSGHQVADDEAGTMLLTDIRAIFEDKGNPDVLPSGVIIDTLTGLEHRPWAEWSKGRPLSPAKLARLLAGYDIHPGSTRIGDKVVRAYRYVTFTDAWERYKTLEVLQRNNPNQNGHELAASKCYTPNACSTLQSATNPTNVEVSSGVALSKVEVADQGMADGELF